MGRSVSVGRGGTPDASARSRVVSARRPRSVRERRRSAREALTAAGVASAPSLTTLDVARLGPAERFFYGEALSAGIANFGGEEWPTESTFYVANLPDEHKPVFRDGGSSVFRSEDGSLALFHLGHGWAGVHVAAVDPAAIAATVATFRAACPASYLADDGGKVPITFWTCGPLGATSRLRRIEASPWKTIERNYSDAVRSELSDLMVWTEPSRDGQLILWQGPPGTGKTWCLRALASEWSSWAEFHYITDPDVFFVERPSYMIDVLLSDSYDVIHEPSGDVVAEAGDKWRVLILEDTGELLAADAKEKYGQGLSRLLNVVDGMIGQGLRVLALITTNDELGDLAPAAIRPGRCASRSIDGGAGPTVFGPLSASEASVWLGETVEEGGTLAELYARSSDAEDAFSADKPAPVEEVVSDDEARRRDFEELLSLARTPLESEALVSSLGPELAETLRDLSESGEITNRESVASALRAVASAHQQTMEAVREVLVASSGAKREGDGNLVAVAALSALDSFARRPEPTPPAQGDVHVHVPKQDLSVHVDAPTLEPHFTVEASKPADVQVDVHVPAPEPPRVEVNVPAVELPPSEIHVHVPPVEAASPKPAGIRVEYDAEGFRYYRPISAEEKEPVGTVDEE